MNEIFDDEKNINDIEITKEELENVVEPVAEIEIEEATDSTIEVDSNQENSFETIQYESNQYYEQPQSSSSVYATSATATKEAKAPKKKGGFAKKLAAVIAAAAVFGVAAGGSFYLVNDRFGNDTKQEQSKDGQSKTTVTYTVPATQVVSNVKVEGESEVADVVENVMPSVVSISCTTTQNYATWPGYYTQQEVPSSGSGIIIGENDDELLIVTNNHVVEDANKVSISFIDGEAYDATIKGTEPSSDLAVVSVKKSELKEDTLNQIKVATIGDSEKLRVGELAIAIGNALGYGQSVTRGCVSALNREITIDSVTYTTIQTDAAINPGNSGGALVNSKGELIGINSAKLASTQVEGMGYAIPISKVLPIITDLMNRETIDESERGYIGVSVKTISEEVSKLYGCPEGVILSEVSNNGPAAKAGLVMGDIITKVNDVEVSTADQLVEKINNTKAGDTIKVTYSRLLNGQYEENTVEVELDKRPANYGN